MNKEQILGRIYIKNACVEKLDLNTRFRKYYITITLPYEGDQPAFPNIMYLHMDNTWHHNCGEENFFETREQAETHLLVYKQSIEFIDENDFGL